ncbi:serine hydrolase [Lysobacter bugurensis]|uniref:Serine hydrolase n=2 Tax=Cognatilysobacter bugurensis TaxID=543356 RepID=A0A918W9Y9_9GAMM|nr:serine hydrolase [Lysobacter bugurensis]
MDTRNKLVSVVAAMAALFSGLVSAATQVESRTSDAGAALDAVIEQRMKDGGMVGVGAAIIVDKKVVWTGGYGFADRERAIRFTPDTVMNIGSISKTFTGAALMRAVQEGKVSLDVDINAYLPFKVVNPHHPDEPITLRQLATHTSGITDRPSVYESNYHFGGGPTESLGGFLESYFTRDGRHYSDANFLKARPGAHREYSNIGAGLAGYIVERAVGEKLNTYTARHFFTPLGMSNSGWFLSEIPPAKLARLYVAQGPRIPIPLYELTTYPDGGVRTSVSDLARFFTALLNDGEYEGARILDKPAAGEMLRFQYTNANKPGNVNIEGDDSVNSGIFWATKYDITRIGHNGSDPGVRTMMLADPKREVGVILFTNTSMGDEESGSYFEIFDALWARAEQLKREASGKRG